MSIAFSKSRKLLLSTLAVATAFSSTAYAQTTGDGAQMHFPDIATNIKNAPDIEQDKTLDVGDVRVRSNTYGSTRSNKRTATPVGCVTVDGAVDANCDGVDDTLDVKTKANHNTTQHSQVLKTEDVLSNIGHDLSKANEPLKSGPAPANLGPIPTPPLLEERTRGPITDDDGNTVSGGSEKPAAKPELTKEQQEYCDALKAGEGEVDRTPGILTVHVCHL
ncbi:hypothetical protein N9W89_14085 [Hellea sp.]|nr:hypothetical protein [Hellea sp.]